MPVGIGGVLFLFEGMNCGLVVKFCGVIGGSFVENKHNFSLSVTILQFLLLLVFLFLSQSFSEYPAGERYLRFGVFGCMHPHYSSRNFMF